ncbi:Ankyrin repeat protein [Phytophthora palmivora]|uniref:Ankyrin repeat protein n=1 Tax=Phytophthora palmivora TaxID=4796 RepID=A0A2P4Y7K8_9STRA|nr:Ankyrin repeat protein [Phytophthora palmivora]
MGNTVTLHSACEYGDLAEVHRLLKTATAEELEATDDSGRTPLLLAVASLKHLREHQELDDFDDLHGFGDSDEETITPTEQEQEQQPVANGNAESSNSDVEEIVNEVKDDTDLELLPKEAEILHLLLQRRVNVDHKDENGWTALHHACFVQNAVAIKMLIHAGARPMRESYGLLPQDLLQRGHMSEWVAQAQELKESLDQITDKSAYAMKLLAFRPSGIVQLDMGGQVEKGSFVTLEYDVPERHSVKDYIQVLISEEDSAEIETGSYHYVPAGAHGQLTISTKDIPPASTVRFVYVKSDINTMSREVVASGCNAVVQASVGEIFQYELFLYERVVEVESIPEFEYIDQPLIVLKRIGIVVGEDIDWVTIRPDNHIVAVNDIRIDAMEFAEAVRVLQENNGRQCTKLLMQNYSACGDFIPEKILGVGVVGKYAYLHPVDEEQDAESDEQTYEEWVRNSHSENGEGIVENATHEQVNLGPVSTLLSAIQVTSDMTATTESAQNAETTYATYATEAYTPPSILPSVPPAEGRGVVSKVVADDDDDPATMSREEKVSASSTIETVVPLHNSLQLVAQLQQGISIGHATR